MISVMTGLLYVIIALALGHLVYESIIAPNKRMALRAELLMIQMELHQMDIEELNENDKVVYHMINESVANLMTRLPKIDISLIFEMKKQYENDAKLRERLEKRHKMVLATENSELKSLLNQSQSVISNAFKANSGAWVMWIIPIAAVSIVMVSVQEFASGIITATSKQIRKLIPSPDIEDELLIA
ncbi:hypothetical protein [Actinobacillus porcinus]|uniref:Uncharacterized protein n=1 Tax=Actinobacillus porcinus TaxID=51048 RepID=A0ABY6TN11_9PAST|nr:hypothetical protein [Actinobacillus porcinus]MCI5764018.1 hypothetical protein [Actinobacillus porcinus]MDY5421397.1 hypothetical protein [Actinobacillus porcinus]VFY93899.1 Uncharacterised protein [Actinobacillus porcinus]VTU09360.1 Uncharacterised protein [Actinobacillus porcinus]